MTTTSATPATTIRAWAAHEAAKPLSSFDYEPGPLAPRRWRFRWNTVACATPTCP